MKPNTKWPFWTSLLLFLVTAPMLYAQQRPVMRPKARHENMDTVARKGILTSFPTNFVAATMKLGYEFPIEHHQSLKLMASFGASQNTDGWYDVDQFSEFGIEAQYRFYINKNRPTMNGLFLSPFAAFKTMGYSGTVYDNYGSVQQYLNNGRVSDFSVGYIIGYQWILSSSLDIDAFIGGADNFISGNNTGGNLPTMPFAYAAGVYVHCGVAVGVAF